MVRWYYKQGGALPCLGVKPSTLECWTDNPDLPLRKEPPWGMWSLPLGGGRCPPLGSVMVRLYYKQVRPCLVLESGPRPLNVGRLQRVDDLLLIMGDLVCPWAHNNIPL